MRDDKLSLVCCSRVVDPCQARAALLIRQLAGGIIQLVECEPRGEAEGLVRSHWLRTPSWPERVFVLCPGFSFGSMLLTWGFEYIISFVVRFFARLVVATISSRHPASENVTIT